MIKNLREITKELKVLIGILLILFPFIYHLINRISASSTNKLVPISVIALIAGAMIEYKHLTPKWSTVFKTAICSFILSFLCFLPGIRETTYNFENHIFLLPYIFLLFFMLISFVLNKAIIIPRMTEGVTMIMSVGIIYWLFDHRFYETNSIQIKVLIAIVFIIAVFLIINAFINIKLTKERRLGLSILSSIIIIVLATDNLLLVYQNGLVEDSAFLLGKISIGLQYFFLGISSIYVLQILKNVTKLMKPLPTINSHFNKDYFKEISELEKEHIDRYSAKQSNIKLSVIFLILTIGFYSLNYSFDLLPRNTAIWLVFFLLNDIVYFYDNRHNKHFVKARLKK